MTIPSSTLQQIVSCIAGYQPDDLPVVQAQSVIARLARRVQPVERLSLRTALGRVLAHDVVSTLDVPAHDNAAMDGYALRGSELAGAEDMLMAVAGVAYAGQPFVGVVPSGHVVRIMTGAVLPDGLDTVVPQELTARLGDGRVRIPTGAVACGDNRRRRGEDLALGEPALLAGRRLMPADLGLLASLGHAEVPVFRRLRVAIFSTGDELRSIGQLLDPGCVYDSNRYTLHGMLSRLGIEALDLGVVRDDPGALAAAFAQAAACADAVISSGGVSVGEADHTRQVLGRLGEVLFWNIAMRPGRPMAIGRIGPPGQEALLFGLPGNPVAVMVTFYAFVRDALLAMSGATPQPLPLLRARSETPLRKKPGRTEYQRGILGRSADGCCTVRLTGAQGSGMLRSMSDANGLVVLHHDQGPVAAGDWVDVMPFDGLV